EPEIARALHEAKPTGGLLSEIPDRAVGGSVVHHYDLQGGIGLRDERVQALRQIDETVPVHHDGGDEGAVAVPPPGRHREVGGRAPRVRDSRHSFHYIPRVLALWPRIPRAPRRPRPSTTRSISTTSTSCAPTGRRRSSWIA